jgi:hypothetical protein
MLYRDQRGSLEESLKTTVDLPATRLALFNHISNQQLFTRWRMHDMVVKYYTDDWRIPNWAPTYVVTFNDIAVGFTNGPVQ